MSFSFTSSEVFRSDEIWYECRVNTYASLDEYGDVCGHHRQIVTREFYVHNHTPKGTWVVRRGDTAKRKRFILHSAGSRRIYPTRREALQAFIRLREFYILHRERDIREANRDIAHAKSFMPTESPR